VIARAARPLLAVASAFAVLAVLLTGGQAAADPRKTLAQVQAELDSLQTQAETASEDYNAAAVELAATQKQLGVAKAKVARIKAQTQDLLASAGSMAAQAYMSGGGGMETSVGLLMSDDPTSFLEQATAVQQISRSQNSTLRRARTAQLILAQAEAQLAQEQAAAAKAAAQMRQHRDEVNHALAQTSALLASLQEADRQRLANIAAAKKKAAAAAAAAARASWSSRSYSSRSNGSPSTIAYTGPASGRAAVAVRYALSQVGDPYSYSANPPSSWDCSKLTAAAWGAAGVSLTPVSYAQANEVRRISTSELRPGDLLFYFNGAHHVAMYIGGGRLVEAASPSHGVWVTDLWNSWSSAHFSFAGRPAG
jgi:cell wall-associated NlpC family hydrolase